MRSNANASHDAKEDDAGIEPASPVSATNPTDPSTKRTNASDAIRANNASGAIQTAISTIPNENVTLSQCASLTQPNGVGAIMQKSVIGVPLNKNSAVPSSGADVNQTNNAKASVHPSTAMGDKHRDSKDAGKEESVHPVDLTTHRIGVYDHVEDDGRLNLKRCVHDRIMNEIFDNGVNKAFQEKMRTSEVTRSFGLYVMVLDNMATGILGSCLKLHHLGERRVSLVENLEISRKPMPNMEAIYFIAPKEKSVLKLIEDFKSKNDRMYKCAHVFFTWKCAEHLFEGISLSPVAQFIRTMKELNVGFFAEESHVFDFNMRDNFFDLYSPAVSEIRQQEALDVLSDKILTLCQTLQICPVVYYQSTPKAFSLALMANRKLEEEDQACKGGLSRCCKDGEAVLLVVDRSVDTITPLLHCMSVQAMVNDVLPVENNCFQFEHLDARGKLVTKTVILDEEEDSLWSEIRHLHVADAARTLPKKFQEFMSEHHIIQKDNPTLKDMGEIMRAFPQFHRELSQFTVHMHLTEVCMQRFKRGLHTVVLAEQNLSTGINGSNGLHIAQYMPFMAPILTDSKRTPLEKIRLLLLYIILKNGLPESDIDKILEHSNIPPWFKTYVINMSFLGINILTRRRAGHNRPPVKARKIDGGYTTARWTPYIKDLLEDVIERELNSERFPCLENSRVSPKSKPQKVIVCFLGGVTYHEMTCAYDVCTQSGVDVLIGGDEILTPSIFLEKIQKLKRWSHMGKPPEEGTIAEPQF